MLAAIYIGVFASVVAYLAWNEGVRRVGPGKATAFYNMLPVYGTLLGVFFLHEPFGPAQLVGGALIIGGSLLAVWNDLRRPMRTPAEIRGHLITNKPTSRRSLHGSPIRRDRPRPARGQRLPGHRPRCDADHRRDARLVNTMTASWGAWGHLWGRDVSFCFVRPQRHTFGFMEQAEPLHPELLRQGATGRPGLLRQPLRPRCGQGRGHGLTPVRRAAQARSISPRRGWCWYAASSMPRTSTADSFLDPTIPAEIYAKADFHRMYVGEIVRCLRA